MPLFEKIRTIAKEIYRADDATADKSVKDQLKTWEEMGFGKLPVCIAKTQYSFSTNPDAKGAPTGFNIPVREVRLSAGAEFIVAICGEIMTMPGLPKVPSADSIDVNAAGQDRRAVLGDMPRLSLCPLTIIRATHRELVEAAAAGGFDAVGFRLIAPRPGDPVHPVEGGRDGVSDLRKRLCRTIGIALFDIESMWLSPATEPETIRPALEICTALGGKNLLIAGNDPEPDRMAANLAAVTALAAEFGIRACIEPTSWCVVHRLDQAKDLIRRAGVANAGIIIDTLHMDRAGETPASMAAFDPTLIAYVQICDAGPDRPASAAELNGGSTRKQAATGRRRVAARRDVRCPAARPDHRRRGTHARARRAVIPRSSQTRR